MDNADFFHYIRAELQVSMLRQKRTKSKTQWKAANGHR